MAAKTVHGISISNSLALSVASTFICILLTIPLGGRGPLVGSSGSFQYKLLQYITGASAVFTFELTGQFIAEQSRLKQQKQNFKKESNVTTSAILINGTEIREEEHPENHGEHKEIGIRQGTSASPRSQRITALHLPRMAIVVDVVEPKRVERRRNTIIQETQREILRQSRRSFELSSIGTLVAALLGITTGALVLNERVPEALASAAAGFITGLSSAQLKKDAQAKLETLENFVGNPTAESFTNTHSD